MSAYLLHIRRERGEISEVEWRRAVESTAGVRLGPNVLEGRNPMTGKPMTIVGQPTDAQVYVPGGAGRLIRKGRWAPVFFFNEGGVHLEGGFDVDDPDDPIYQAVAILATKLGAVVEGAGGERYDLTPPPALGSSARTLSTAQAKKVYDRLGARQDSHAFYEDAALDALVAAGDFGHSRRVAEFGCGTGRFALRLLADELPEDAAYFGFDLSATMVDLACERVSAYSERASITRTEGSARLPLEAGSCDRLVSNFVFDLLATEQIREVVDEAHRLLEPGGLLCVTSLSRGCSPLSRAVIAVVRAIHRSYPAGVGGCRPIDVGEHVSGARWQVLESRVVVAWGVPTQVFVARRLGT